MMKPIDSELKISDTFTEIGGIILSVSVMKCRRVRVCIDVQSISYWKSGKGEAAYFWT
jgi:hypothetical protein